MLKNIGFNLRMIVREGILSKRDWCLMNNKRCGNCGLGISLLGLACKTFQCESCGWILKGKIDTKLLVEGKIGETSQSKDRKRGVITEANYQEEAYYNDGLLNGRYSRFEGINGRNIIGKYENGKKSGTWFSYILSMHEKPLIISVLNYRDGLFHGKCTEYMKSGLIRKVITYKNGIKHGKTSGYGFRSPNYPHDEISKYEGQFNNGCKDGNFLEYDLKGKIKREWEFRAGVFSAEYTEYSSDGTTSRGSIEDYRRKTVWNEVKETYEPIRFIFDGEIIEFFRYPDTFY